MRSRNAGRRDSGAAVAVVVASGLIVSASLGGEGVAPYNAPDAEGRLRVVHVGTVAPDVIGVTIMAGRALYGRQIPYEPREGDRVDRRGHQRWVYRGGKYFGSLVGRDEKLIYTAERVIGERQDAGWVDGIDSYRVSSPDDAKYRDWFHPAAVYRKTKPSAICRTGPKHPWQFDSPTETVIYLRLAAPLTKGSSYAVSFRGAALEPVSFKYDTASLRSEAVHVSHVGFHPGDPAKVAFLSCWLGSGGALDYHEGMTFKVLDARTGRAAFEGRTRLAKAKDDRTEDAYRKNYNGTDVYEMDFSAFRGDGEYVVAVEGVGCSFPFRVGPDVWRDAFAVACRGFFHQRSGMELGPPRTDFKRPRPFHPDDGVRVHASTCTLMESGNGLNYSGTDKGNFKNLVAGKTDRIVPDAWGGYMDAGDWDRRVQHLVASRYMIELAEIFPDYFAGLSLDIPESRTPEGRGVPDVVSEALFNLDFYRRLQTAEGGVRGGIESAEHPREGEGSWQESLEVMAYAPGIWSSHWYAGVAARAALWLRERRPERARMYRETALRAMEWAEREWPTLGEPKRKPGGVVDLRNMAAAEFFRLTGDGRWHDIFLDTTAFTDPKAALDRWPDYDQRDNAWVYARTDKPGTNAEVRENCRKAILREADERAGHCMKTGFRWTKNPWTPPAWGAFAAPYAMSLCRAHALTGDVKYLRAAVLACQHGLGANPINICYTTRLGHKWPQHPLHIDSRVTGQPPPPGITVFGPLGYERGKDQWGQKNANPHLFPPFEKWPTTEAYWDIFWYPPMTEFTPQQPMARNAYAWGYLAAAARPAPAGRD